jgi:transcriptional regulator GlxA family with amidase domain
VTKANSQLANKFRDAVQQIQTAAAACPNFESELAAKHATAVLQKLASSIVGLQSATEPHAGGRPRMLQRDIIDRSIAVLETRAAEPVLVGELATAAGVSERTLRRAFVDYFGVAPVRYLQLRQLHLINRALRAADPEVDSVTDLLVRYGEWEFGRFASRYRHLFGELPSETLRAKTNRRR